MMTGPRGGWTRSLLVLADVPPRRGPPGAAS
jgi:hypothetical protein